MAHWAEISETNTVLRVLVTDNNDSNGDEGYQWLLDNLGGKWIKCSYNTINGVHNSGGTPLRWTYPGVGYIYNEEHDFFLRPAPYPSWTLDIENKTWLPPVPKPDSGLWEWSEETLSWKEFEIE